MPGWYTHFTIAKRAIESLNSNPGAAPIFIEAGVSPGYLKTIAEKNSAYFMLGAIGPDAFMLLPDFKPPMGNFLWKAISTVKEIYEWLDVNFIEPWEHTMAPVIDNAADIADALTGGVLGQLSDISSRALDFIIDSIIVVASRQYDIFGLLGSGVPSGYDEQTFFWSDMLHYRQTYRFGAKLWEIASKEADKTEKERLQAYALGYITHLATDVTGHDYVNQKTGGPFRLHWQRHHLIENQMDAFMYNMDFGSKPIYNMLSNSALHLWVAFKSDGSSHVNAFEAQPNPSYDAGDNTPAKYDRKSKWDVDSDMPEGVANLISNTMKEIFVPGIAADSKGQANVSPTIICDILGLVVNSENGMPSASDIMDVYTNLYAYLKYTTTDYYKMIKPEPPEVVVIAPFPTPPGAGQNDSAPDDDDSFCDDILEVLLAIIAWPLYLGEVVVWALSIIPSIIAGVVTYPLREFLYEYVQLPLYNMWLSMHWYLTMTGFVFPMKNEINPGLHTLGKGVNSAWNDVLDALSDPFGGLQNTGSTINEPSGEKNDKRYPHNVVVDPPGWLKTAITFIKDFPTVGPSVDAPSEFLRPWQWPAKDNEGHRVFSEYPLTHASPYSAPSNPSILVSHDPGDKNARLAFESATSFKDTQKAYTDYVLVPPIPSGTPRRHLGDPVDYSGYLMARLTRDKLDYKKLANFNLDSDRGYGALCWDWLRLKDGKDAPACFKGKVNPATGTADNLYQRVYNAPYQPGYGWTKTDALSGPQGHEFNTNKDEQAVNIRYIDREEKFI